MPLSIKSAKPEPLHARASVEDAVTLWRHTFDVTVQQWRGAPDVIVQGLLIAIGDWFVELIVARPDASHRGCALLRLTHALAQRISTARDAVAAAPVQQVH